MCKTHITLHVMYNKEHQLHCDYVVIADLPGLIDVSFIDTYGIDFLFSC